MIEKGITDRSVVFLEDTTHILGKDVENGISFDNPFVSRRHAHIERIEGEYSIRDLGSTNGTFVNGKSIGTDYVRLNHGDRIELAEGQVIMNFHLSGSTTTLRLPSQHPGAGKGIVVEGPSREVYVGGVLIEPPLSKKEFDVLHLLYQRSGEACSKEEISVHGWPEREGDVGDQEIEQCIRRIRVRLENDPSNPHYVITLRGIGYKLVNP
jgi:hypothetical protein